MVALKSKKAGSRAKRFIVAHSGPYSAGKSEMRRQGIGLFVDGGRAQI
jgi:hypothetical protein